MKTAPYLGVAAITLTSVALSCAGTNPVPQCVPGTTQSCVCANNTGGAQTCNSNGSFAPCICSVLSDGGDDGGNPSDGGNDAGKQSDGGPEDPVDAGTDSGSTVDASTPDAGSCLPESDNQLCGNLGATCGLRVTADACGTQRLLHCGPCNLLGDIPLVNGTDGGLNCIYGAFEPGNPGSTFAFQYMSSYPTLNFKHPGLTDGGAPAEPASLDIDFTNPNRPPIADIFGSSLTNAYSAKTLNNSQVAPLSNAALRVGNQIAVEVEAKESPGVLPGFPPMVWYVHCSGIAALGAPETDAAFCGAHGWQCDSLTAIDNTGRLRTTPSCGPCASPNTCIATSYQGLPRRQCDICTPETDMQFCRRLDKDCDVVIASDNCGTSRSANCGSCTPPSTCAGSGTTNQCGGLSMTCKSGYYRHSNQGLPMGCPDGDGGVVLNGPAQTFSRIEFVWNPANSRYEANTGVSGLVAPGPVKLTLSTAQSTTLLWTEFGASGTRNGNVISGPLHTERNSPSGCSNSWVFSDCSGSANFIFGQ